MKFVILVILVCLIYAIALGISNQYKDRYNLYVDFDGLLAEMQLNLSFKKEKLLNVVKSYRCNKDCNEIIQNYTQFLSKNDSKLLITNKLLDDDEKSKITKILTTLGNDDSNTEKLKLEEYREYLKEKVNTTKLEKEKYCSILKKLALLFGLALALILI